jgi:hypothetical protein
MARRPTVQHWIACLEVRVVPPVAVNNFYDLLRVGHVHTFSGDVEFPAAIPRLDMFARFVNGTGVAEFEAELVWLDALGGERVVETFGPFRVTFRPGEPLRDTVFRLLNVPLDGTGRYAVRLRIIRPHRRRPLADEYFTVVQLP